MRPHHFGALLLLAAAPAFLSAEDPRGSLAYLLTFTLEEGPGDAAKKMGAPHEVVDYSANYTAWNYRLQVEDLHDFSHTLLFEKPGRKLVSITRTGEQLSVDELFPASETTVKYFPDASKPTYGARVRKLKGGRLLLAMGSMKPGQPAAQLIVIREAYLPAFFPWAK